MVAGIAQLAERQICNLNVVGANPTTGSYMLPDSLTGRAADFGLAGYRFDSCSGIIPR